jgi:2-methylcitrate dehydratase PrpD
MSNPLVYDEAAVRDPLVRDLARRIELVPLEDAGDEGPGVWAAEILIERGPAERHTLRTRPYKGSPPNPFTWVEACEKFRRYTASVLGAPQAAAIVDAVGGLERVSDMAEVARLVAAA